MGLLSKMAEKAAGMTQKKVTDDVLLALSMGTMAFADGSMDEEEVATIEAFATTLPEFKDSDCFCKVWNDSAKLFNKHDGNMEKIVMELKNLSTPALKRKAFILAADMALSSGDVDEEEDKLLEMIKNTLAIEDSFAEKVLEVLSAKYSK